MFLNIKVDKNDGDYLYIKSEINEDDIADIRIMAEAIKKFKPYKSVSKSGLVHKQSRNFPNGGMYGFDMHRPDLGGKSTYEYYVKSKKVSEQVFNTFKKYVKERSFHTIHKIKLDKEILFKKGIFEYYD